MLDRVRDIVSITVTLIVTEVINRLAEEIYMSRVYREQEHIDSRYEPPPFPPEIAREKVRNQSIGQELTLQEDCVGPKEEGCERDE